MVMKDEGWGRGKGYNQVSPFELTWKNTKANNQAVSVTRFPYEQRGLSRFAHSPGNKDELGTLSKLLPPKPLGFLFDKRGCGGCFVLLQFTLLWV